MQKKTPIERTIIFKIRVTTILHFDYFVVVKIFKSFFAIN